MFLYAPQRRGVRWQCIRVEEYTVPRKVVVGAKVPTRRQGTGGYCTVLPIYDSLATRNTVYCTVHLLVHDNIMNEIFRKLFVVSTTVGVGCLLDPNILLPLFGWLGT